MQCAKKSQIKMALRFVWTRLKEIVSNAMFFNTEEPSLETLLLGMKIVPITQQPETTLQAICAAQRYLIIYVVNPETANKNELNALIAANSRFNLTKQFQVVYMNSHLKITQEQELDAMNLPWPRLDLPIGETKRAHFNKRALFDKLHVEMSNTQAVILDLEEGVVLNHNILPRMLQDNNNLDEFPYYQQARCELYTLAAHLPLSHQRRYPNSNYMVVVFAGNDQQQVFNRLAPLIRAYRDAEKYVLIAGTDVESRKMWACCGGSFGRYNEMDDGPIMVLINVDGGESQGDISYLWSEDVYNVTQVTEYSIMRMFKRTRQCKSHGLKQVQCRAGNCYGMHGLQPHEFLNTCCHCCQEQQRIDPMYMACLQCNYRECKACHEAALAENARYDQQLQLG